MTIQDFLNELNEDQLKAATTFEGPILILAGAGSGKTKTIVTRTANMIANDINPSSILVMTFTNKAAKEMKERGQNILKEIGISGTMPTFTTFHSWGLNFLKSYINYKLSFKSIKENFTIADENIQKKIIKEHLPKIFEGNLDFKDKHFFTLLTIFQNNLISYDSPKKTYEEILSLIDKKKKQGKFLTLLEDNMIKNKRDLRKFSELFNKYKEVLRKNNLVDFDDLINLPISILEEDKKVREYIKNKYDYIMVDEFQDTNFAQIKLLNLILNDKQNICVVGDDSQSIYGWRGADIEYILSFHKKYDEVLKINLKKNYRSTKSIVSHANKLISNANEKHEFKEALEAFKKEKGKIIARKLENEYEEAEIIAYYISELLSKKVQPKDIAVLYRNNFIANSIEKELIKRKIPYKIYKGRALMQKKVIQEFMSFIFLFINLRNNVALEMALTSTAKILTQNKINEMKEKAHEKGIDLSEYIFEEHWKSHKLSKPQKNKLESFILQSILMNKLLKEKTISMEEFLHLFYEKFNLIKEYEDKVQNSTSLKTVEQAEKALEDIGNLNSIIMSYKSIEDFVESVSLDGEDSNEEEENKVNLMTIHSSKGLEFDFVFLARMNQGVIPSSRSLASPALIEEERRLAYVAITRAKKFLHVSFIRRQRNEILTPSMFLFEAGILKQKKRF